MTYGVSVVVATFRRPDRLAACLDGLRSQSLRADEVLIIVHDSDEPSTDLVAQLARDWPELRCLRVERRGLVAALNCGLGAARAEIVAFTDDDAVPAVDWLERIVATFERHAAIAAVGGRDLVVDNGRVVEVPKRSRDLAAGPTVGRLQWFGRMLGNHHIGFGAPRDVDVLKGVNMSFRRSAVARLGFDQRLRGEGATMHSELSICLPLRRRGLRVVYDPEIEVMHFPSPRLYGVQRSDLGSEAVFAAAHNEALQILDHVGAVRRLVYDAWGTTIGNTDAPGVAVLGRDLLRRKPAAWSRFKAAQRGRRAAWKTRRSPRIEIETDNAASSLLHRPVLGWRRRHLFGVLGLRPAVGQHTEAEAAALMRYAADARALVELGVAEGGSAAELRSVMSPSGHLYLVDPYEPGRLGVSMARLVARRTVSRARRGRVKWLRLRSDEAVRGWQQPIDFLFIDADHSYERAAGDWRLWSPFVVPGGHVALHDSVVFPGGWTDERSGPVQLLDEIVRGEPDWLLVDQADSLSVLRRAGEANSTKRADARQLRILRVADMPNAATSGVSGYVLSSGAAIERAGHHVSFWFRDRLAPAIAHPGLRRLIVPWLIAGNVLRAQRRGERFDVIEINEPQSGVYGLLARLLPARLPACAALSHGLNDRFWQAERTYLRAHGRTPPLRSRVLVPLTLLSQARLGLRTAEAVLVTNSEDRRYLIEQRGVPAERVSCAFGGAPEDLFEVDKAAHEGVRLLFLGSWIERKGTLELLDAWRRLAAERPNVSLTIAGPGDIDRARADVGGLPRVELIPTVARGELPGLLAAHDAFVLPSWFEGMPLAMLEAAAAGLACVVCAVCGNVDVFRPDDPGRDGAILIPPNDANALHRALLTLVDDGALRAALGASARERARHFTWAANAEQAVAAYAGAIDRHFSRRSPDGHRSRSKF
jgi:glycosyltransferase involved in cell wall biosynthesis/GT2 family glycosyltransferase/predicted O-methyltransferase YrrM